MGRAFRLRTKKTPPLQERRFEYGVMSELAPIARRRKADLRKLDRILVLVDRNILPLPIGQRRGPRRQPQVQHASDHDGMGMTLDNILDLTIDRSQRVCQERYAGRRGYPS